MSQERIVNRVSQLQVETERSSEVPVTAEAQRAGQIGRVEPLVPTAPGPAQETPRDVIDKIVDKAAADLGFAVHDTNPNWAGQPSPLSVPAEEFPSVPEGVAVQDWSSCVVCNPNTNSAINHYCEEHKELEESAQAKRELVTATPLIEELLQNRFLVRDPDLAAFKKQVIAAFKHFGLDTKQFFGV